jgi:hypothetical protein
MVQTLEATASARRYSSNALSNLHTATTIEVKRETCIQLAVFFAA